MATTIPNNEYIIIDQNNIVISSFHGYDLPYYNEEMVNVVDVTSMSVKPQLTWTYDPTTNKYSPPPEGIFDIPLEVPEKTPLQILKEQFTSNIMSSISYMGNEFQVDGGTILVINSYMSLLNIDGILPENFFWLDKSNNKINMTIEEFKGFASLAIKNYYTHFANYVEQRQML